MTLDSSCTKLKFLPKTTNIMVRSTRSFILLLGDVAGQTTDKRKGVRGGLHFVFGSIILINLYRSFELSYNGTDVTNIPAFY